MIRMPLIYNLQCFSKFFHSTDYPEIVKLNNELLTKNAILKDAQQKFASISVELSAMNDGLAEQYERQKQAFLAQDEVQARIARIVRGMNVNFPALKFEPVAPDCEILPLQPKLAVQSTVAKPKNRRASIYDIEMSMIDFCDVSGYDFNPPSDSDLSFASYSPRKSDFNGVGNHSYLTGNGF